MSKNKRQEDKLRQKMLKEKFFLVNWKESDMYDVLPSKSVVPPEGCDILCLNEGMTCRGLYSGEYHDATVVATGKHGAMIQSQKKHEDKVEANNKVWIFFGNSKKSVKQRFTPSLPVLIECVSQQTSNEESDERNEIVSIEDKGNYVEDVVGKKRSLPESDVNKPKKIRRKMVKGCAAASTEGITYRGQCDEEHHDATVVATGEHDALTHSQKKYEDKVEANNKQQRSSKESDKRNEIVSIEVEENCVVEDAAGIKRSLPQSDVNKPKKIRKMEKGKHHCTATSTEGSVHVIERKKKSVIAATTKQLQQQKFMKTQTMNTMEDEAFDEAFDTHAAGITDETTQPLSMKVRINVAARSMTLEWNTQIHALEKKADEMEMMMYEIKEKVKKQGKLLKSLMMKHPVEDSNTSIAMDADIEENEIILDADHVQIFGKKVKRLQLESAKLHSNEGKAALQLLGILFTDEELVNGNPRGVTNSNDEARKKNIRQLDPRRMNYIKDHIEHKWGKGHFAPLLKSLTQKCTDMYKNHKELRLK